MAARRRDRSEWEAMVSELEASGVPVREFASERRVNPRTLSWWRWRLRSEGEADAEPATRHGFVPVVVREPVEEPTRRPASVGEVTAELPGGVVLRFEHELDEGGLRTLAAAFSGVR